VTGFLSIQQLTTNVTGHFAFFIDEVFKLNFSKSLVFFLYIFFFFLGSFVSNFLVELSSKRSPGKNYIIPTSMESIILIAIPFLERDMVTRNPDIIAFSLLFAMGLQNSLVTSISNATVRTTHLTGLFTDLGIELSQLFFYKTKEQRERLFSAIKLRLTIISFFFLGGLCGGIFYSAAGLYLLVFAGASLILGLFYDSFLNAARKSKS
jgi:uncharacterized membrane protein YoaK (UPF0700 family)